MFTRLLQKYIDLVKRIDSRQDDEIQVHRYDHLDEVLQAREKILWRGTPSARHAWADHDQLEAAGSVGERPVSLTARKIELTLALFFIVFMFLAGAFSVYSGITEILQAPDISSFAFAVFLVLTGITFMSGLPFLLRPLTNGLRARQLVYLLTSSRALIVRRGHAWSEILVRSPVIISVSLLMLYSVILFGGIFLESAYQDVINGAGVSTWLARFFIIVAMTPLAIIFTTLGFVGMRFQLAIIVDAIKDRNGLFVRSFDFDDIRRNDFPVLSRLRKDGVGDVILGQDSHWEYDIDFNQAPWHKTNAVGFLSVADARQVMKNVERALDRQQQVDGSG